MTSMKTIIARFTELKENIAGTEESEFQDLDLNRVDKALKSVGVQLKDTTGQFRDLDDVFMELSSIWQDLDRNTQRYVATIAAGSRQQSRFLALMDGYERNVELMKIAADSTGQADKQFAKYSDTMELKLNTLATKWEQLRQNILGQDFFKDLLDKGSGVLDKIIAMNLTPAKVAVIVPFAVMMARSFIKTFAENISNAGNSLQAAFNNLGVLASRKIASAVGQTGSYSFATASIERRENKVKASDEFKAVQEAVNIQNKEIQISREKLKDAQALLITKQNIVKQEQQSYSIAVKEQRKQKDLLYNEQSALLRQRSPLYEELGRTRLNIQGYEARLQENSKDWGAKRAKEQALIREKELLSQIEKIDEQIRGIDEQRTELENRINGIVSNKLSAEKAVELQEEEITKEKEIQVQKEDQLVDLVNKRNSLLNNIKANSFATFMDKAGGIPTILKGMAAGGQQVSSTFGMMASMLLAGAKATDTLNMAMHMSITQFIPQLLNFFLAILKYLTQSKILTDQQRASLVGLRAARAANNISQQETITLNELEAASATEAAAAEALLTAGISLAIAAVAMAVVGIASLIAKQKESNKETAYAQSATGKYKDAIEQLNKKIQESQKYYDEAKKELEDHTDNYKLLTETYEKYGNKIALTEEEAQDFLTAQQKIAEIAPELIAGYDEQGNKILAMADAWQDVINKEKEAMKIAAAEKAESSVIAVSQSMAEKALEVKQKKDHQDIAQIFQKIFKDDTHLFDENVMQAEWDQGPDTRRLNATDDYYSETYFSNLEDFLNKISNYQGISYAQMLFTFAQSIEDKKQSAELGELIKEKLASGKYGTTQFTSEATGLNYLEELAKYLTEGTGQARQETANQIGLIFKDLASSNYNYELKNVELELEQQKKEFDKGMEEIASGYAYRSDTFLKANSDQQNIMTKFLAEQYTLDYDTLYANFKKGTPDADETKFFGYVQKYIQKNFKDIDFEEVFQNAGFTDASFGILTEIQKQFSTDLYLQAKALKDKIKTGEITQAFYDSWIGAHESAFKSRKKDVETLGTATGTEFITNKTGDIIGIRGNTSENWKEEVGDVVDLYGQLGTEGGHAFAQNYAKAVENNGKNGRQAAASYATGIKNAIEDVLGTGDESQGAKDYVAAYDFSQVSTANEKNRRRSFAAYLSKEYGIAFEEAEALFDSLKNEAEKAGLYTAEQLEHGATLGLTEDIGKIVEQLGNHQKTLEKYSHKTGTNAKISTTEWEEIEDVIADLTNPSKGGLDSAIFSNLLHRDKSGNAVFEYKEFFNILGDNIDDVINHMLTVEDLTEEERNNILHLRDAAKLYRGEWMTIEDLISRTSNLVSSFSSAASEQIKNGFVSAKSIQSLLEATSNVGLDSEKMASFFNDKMNFDFNAAYEYISSQIEMLEATNNLTAADEEQLLIWKALKKELYLAKIELQNEAETTDEVADAWKDYNKQLDTVKEKQEALNDKIEAYNKLLYGDELRKSGLDLFYNYNEAISTFNDEMSRAQDILADTKNIGDATAAFEVYANATHKLIVEEKAKQEELKRGLNEYARMIEQGYDSYVDKETGRTIKINFGDYVKFDQSTGKYLINQSLLNRAKFNDEYKNLIEEQVETYNKYADEYKKSQDEVLKAEKDFEKKRIEALKNYTDYEKTIAEELKNQYEEEVDNLKEKYDAMKEEDDDYIKALQEAIDKQRKLRDRESKFEDLAKKEKKLSLISRDTSGANRIQQLSLEEEIQKNRQDLLDEQIDNIIDGMQKLYESQEETRNVEIELKEAIIDNTALINSQAEELGKSFVDVDSYINFMTQSEEFAMMSYAQQQEKIEEYRETYAAAAQYMAIQNMDATSKTGDFIRETIETTSEEISWVISNTSSTFAEEASRAYQSVHEEVNKSLSDAIKNIQDARDALKEATEKLDEYARKARELEEKRNLQVDLNLGNPGADYAPDEVKNPNAPEIVNPNAPTGGDNNGTPTPDEIKANKNLDKIRELYFWRSGQSKEEYLEYVKDRISKITSVDKLHEIWEDLEIGTKFYGSAPVQSIQQTIIREIEEIFAKTKYANGGLVDFTGPAWVDGTKSAPEAFLNPEDTKRIGDAARILSNLPIFNSYGEATNTITNNSGDIAIEINLNVDKLSSELDINEMLNRVKEEIVAVARPIGINTILTQQ